MRAPDRAGSDLLRAKSTGLDRYHRRQPAWFPRADRLMAPRAETDPRTIQWHRCRVHLLAMRASPCPARRFLYPRQAAWSGFRAIPAAGPGTGFAAREGSAATDRAR